MSQYYRVFDLSLESDIACPELLPAEAVPEPDIVIRHGDVPSALAQPADHGPRWQAAPGEFLVHVEGLGDFHVHAGKVITVQPAADAPVEELRSYILSGCLSILLHQRRLFVLHCSAVATQWGAVLFAGKSGTGKSTTVSAFLERGYHILADDMLALSVQEDQSITALPGFPQVKLWADSARALGRSIEGLRRVTPEHEKFISPEHSRFSPEPAPLHAIYDLRVVEGARLSLEPLPHTTRFHILLDHTWQKATLDGLGVREWHFRTAAQIASLTYAARLTRPPEPLDIKPAADLIEADIQLGHSLA